MRWLNWAKTQTTLAPFRGRGTGRAKRDQGAGEVGNTAQSRSLRFALPPAPFAAKAALPSPPKEGEGGPAPMMRMEEMSVFLGIYPNHQSNIMVGTAIIAAMEPPFVQFTLKVEFVGFKGTFSIETGISGVVDSVS